jgi:hypothetical protein
VFSFVKHTSLLVAEIITTVKNFMKRAADVIFLVLASSIDQLGATTLSTTTFSILTLSKMTLSIRCLFVTLSTRNSQHK